MLASLANDEKKLRSTTPDSTEKNKHFLMFERGEDIHGRWDERVRDKTRDSTTLKQGMARTRDDGENEQGENNTCQETKTRDALFLCSSC